MQRLLPALGQGWISSGGPALLVTCLWATRGMLLFVSVPQQGQRGVDGGCAPVWVCADYGDHGTIYDL